MIEKQIRSVVRKHFKTLRNTAKRLDEHYSADDIHDFRVTIKKLRAFLRLLKHNRSKYKPLKLSKSIKDLYDALGAARNLEIVSEQIYKVCVQDASLLPVKYLQFIKNSIQEKKADAQKLAVSKIVKKGSRYIYKYLPKTCDGKISKQFVKNANSKLAAIVACQELTDDQLHEARKIFKDLVYVWDYLPKAAKNMLPPFLLAPGKLEELTDRLGAHQDLVVTTTFLAGSFKNASAFKGEKNTLASLTKRLFFYKEVVKQPILEELKLAYSQ